VEALRRDPSTPDTRASDSPQRYNPVSAGALVNLTAGGNDPGSSGNILHSRVRFFDAAERRAGLPQDVAALVEKIRTDGVDLVLVNTNQVHPRKLSVQMGAYGEHHCPSVSISGQETQVEGRRFTVDLAPGAGASLRIRQQRYRHQPALELPW
jgi:hypothetical protein